MADVQYSDNRVVVNEEKLTLIEMVTKRTMGLLIHKADSGIFKTVENTDSYKEFQNNLDDIIISKLRKQFKL